MSVANRAPSDVSPSPERSAINVKMGKMSLYDVTSPNVPTSLRYSISSSVSKVSLILLQSTINTFLIWKIISSTFRHCKILLLWICLTKVPKIETIINKTTHTKESLFISNYLVDFGDCYLCGVILIPIVFVQLAEQELELIVASWEVLRLGEAARDRLCAALFPHQSL